MFSLRIQSPWEEEEVKESESTSTGRTLMMSKSTASGTAPVEDVFKGLTVKDDGEEEEDRGPTKAVRFSLGNPRVEETRGVMHLYRNVRDNPATLDTLPVGRSPLVCVLAVPNYMTYADFCQFSGSFIQNILEMRIVRNDAFNDRYSVLMTFDNQNSADDFYRHYNRKPFSSMEAEICHVLFTADVQYTESIEHAATPPTGLTELPTCPVCLAYQPDWVLYKMNGKLGVKVKALAKERSRKTLQGFPHGGGSQRTCSSLASDDQGDKPACSSGNQSIMQRRLLRSHYLALKNSIAKKREEVLNPETDKFDSLISRIESLHGFVQRPREQVADAETLSDIATTLFASIRNSQNNDGLTPAEFINAVLQNYGNQEIDQTCIMWQNLELLASPVFQNAAGTCTMLGPMESEPKQRKAVGQRKRSRPTESTHPQAVEDPGRERKSETDKNMATMFNILRKHKLARLDSLVLNRMSFSQTVENIFTLSFLVKDGRVEMSFDENGNHVVAPRNAPTAQEMASGKAFYSQFVFRFDYRDWKSMVEATESGEELMPHRTISLTLCSSEKDPVTPVRKLSRNRGWILSPALGMQDENKCGSGMENGDMERPALNKINRCLL